MLSTDWICLNMSCCTGAVDVEGAVKYAISAIEICKEGDVEMPPIKSNRPPHSVEIRQIYHVIEKNIATGETSPAITPYHTYHFSISTSLTFITSKLPSQDDFHHLITFTTR